MHIRHFLVMLFFILGSVFQLTPILCAQDLEEVVTDADSEDVASKAGGEAEPEISYNLRRNEFFLESLRQKNLANLALDDGEYEQSSFHSEEAIRFAKLSDDFINKRLVQQRAGKAIADAQARLAWAKLENIKRYYPKEFNAANSHYDEAIDARKENNWESALASALQVLQDLEAVAAPPKNGKPPANLPVLPTQYKVRPWDPFGDCLWNIAERFYGDPRKWTVLYAANKDKLPDPKNPNWIKVGTLLDIPSLNGESRVGMWDSGQTYQLSSGS
ncbi:MAG: DUF4398 domain-containing protein [Termitinemataceae bacterium]|nr:MAG: DUF4398 domain-containing protein [Termitinemataceae bacterium]